jgi:hypothetical protein
MNSNDSSCSLVLRDALPAADPPLPLLLLR